MISRFVVIYPVPADPPPRIDLREPSFPTYRAAFEQAELEREQVLHEHGRLGLLPAAVPYVIVEVLVPEVLQ